MRFSNPFRGLRIAKDPIHTPSGGGVRRFPEDTSPNLQPPRPRPLMGLAGRGAAHTPAIRPGTAGGLKGGGRSPGGRGVSPFSRAKTLFDISLGGNLSNGSAPGGWVAGCLHLTVGAPVGGCDSFVRLMVGRSEGPLSRDPYTW